MLRMVSYPHRPQSGHIMCYLHRTYHVLPTADPRALTTPLLGRILLDAIWEIFILGFKTTPMENSHETKHCTDKTRDLLRRHDLPGLVRLRRRPRELLTGKRAGQLGLHLYWDAFRPHCRYTSR